MDERCGGEVVDLATRRNSNSGMASDSLLFRQGLQSAFKEYLDMIARKRGLYVEFHLQNEVRFRRNFIFD